LFFVSSQRILLLATKQDWR